MRRAYLLCRSDFPSSRQPMPVKREMTQPASVSSAMLSITSRKIQRAYLPCRSDFPSSQQPPPIDAMDEIEGIANEGITTTRRDSIHISEKKENRKKWLRFKEVVSVRVCRDITTRRSLGYAYVNFTNPNDAARALDMLNFTPINNKAIRIMYSNRDPSTRTSAAANIFIKNLDKSIDNKALHDTFSAFGNVLSCKIATDASGQSKGYGYVQFDQEEAAQNAIDKLNGMALNDKVVYVGPFLRKQERENTADNESKEKFSNVFVKNLSESTTEEDLSKVFAEFGQLTSTIVMKEDDGKSKCFGFVNFLNPDDAARAVKELNGKKFDDKEWYVGKAQKKSERERELKGRFEQGMKELADKHQGVNLYLKNLDDSVGDDKLREMFSEFGMIASCKIMRDPNGISKGSAFVAFSTPEEASRALAEMNGKMVGGKPLYVAHAQRKEDRKARLQAQFSQMGPGMAPVGVPRMPIFPPGAPPLGQQLFYGQAPPALIPPQPGFGYQPSMVPGMRPAGGHMPNFFMPLVQQGGHQQPRPVGRRGGQGPGQMMQQPMHFLPHQMLPSHGRGRSYGYPQGRNMQGGNFPSMPSHEREQQPLSALATALANASPDQQRTMLGENLYPLVVQLEPDHAAKVTGMLLEMDQTEVLHLLESPESLKAKVAEAMEVLRNVAQQSPHGQMASLSLSDES
ncbi:polyadenylate-binding protein 2-like [Asparagus officinalis]|uniref:polyadenylate-binding protein 2-like n=1 Tax=Asparagus officinalis TaxID=4686 RepID=UPI00098E4B49|nr:polyadenylate-binding protein 2-like [Asparagus officinalis]